MSVERCPAEAEVGVCVALRKLISFKTARESFV